MKRLAECRNYSRDELRCRCGCGLDVTDSFVIALQAFIAILERKLMTKVRHVVSGGARCKKHNDEEGGKPDSRHVHQDAVDGTYDKLVGEKWEQIPNAVIAAEARRSGLFGGVGYKQYADAGENLVHLDGRPGRWPAATW